MFDGVREWLFLGGERWGGPEQIDAINCKLKSFLSLKFETSVQLDQKRCGCEKKLPVDQAVFDK